MMNSGVLSHGKANAPCTKTAVSDIVISDIVVSVSGRDRGKLFFVVCRDGNYAMLCDGRSRRIENPKRKKIKHMRLEAKRLPNALKLRNGIKVTNSEIRKALAEYQAGNHGNKEVCK